MGELIDIIVPVYNEEGNVREFVRRIRSLPLELNLIFIDNGSTDKTVEVLQQFPGIRVIRHAENEGYGASICDGLRYAEADILIIIDADCEYPPEVIPALLKELETCDVVFASRFLERQDARVPFLKSIGNRTITALYNLLFCQNITDLYTGCKALRRSALNGFILKRKGFEHVLELGVKLAKRKVHIQEIFIEYSPRRSGRSKMRHISEGLKCLLLILWYRFHTD